MITSRTNELIKEIKKLSENKYRSQKGLFIAEGNKFISDISQKGIKAVWLLSSQPENDKNILCENYVSVNDGIIEYLSEVKSPQNMIAVYKVPVYFEEQLFKHDKILLLDNIQNPDNVGTLIRSASCAGFDAVMLFGSCADPYNAKAVRASAGASVDIVIVKADLSLVKMMRQNGYELIGSCLSAEKMPENTSGKIIVCVGNEGNGMSDELISICDKLVKLPMSGKCESLNAACAGTLLMYIIGGMI